MSKKTIMARLVAKFAIFATATLGLFSALESMEEVGGYITVYAIFSIILVCLMAYDYELLERKF